MGLIHVYGKSEIRCVCLAPNVSEDASEVVDIKSGAQSPSGRTFPKRREGLQLACGGWRVEALQQGEEFTEAT